MNDRRATGGSIAARLQAPGLPAGGTVSRRRLLERLTAARERVVLVTAPAGFGKTVLVTEALQGASFVWLSLDDLDNDPGRLIRHLGAAVELLAPGAGEEVVQALRVAAAGAGIGRDDGLTASLERLPRHAVLVLDDVQVLESEASWAVLRLLLDPRIAAPRVFLLSRVVPPLPLGRLRLAGDLLELHEDDLRFTLDEARALLAMLLPGGLDEELVGRLGQRTEGWAAGLRLAALALEHAPDRRAVVDAFAGTHRFIADYLVEEALAGQPEPVQQFLMDTSLLERFTADACVAVTADEHARALLRQVETAKLFLMPLGGGGEWYRYHQLFAELLQFRRQRLQPGRGDVLHERASRWFEEQGDLVAALEHAAAIPGGELLAALLDRHAIQFLARSELASLLRWLERVPEPVQQRHPTLLLCCGWLRTLGDRAPDLEPLLAAARAALPGAPYSETRREATRLELEILRAFHARFSGRLEDALRAGAAVLDELPHDSTALRGRILFNQARTYMALGEMRRAAGLLERSIEDNLAAGTDYLVLLGMAHAAAIQLETDGVPAARRSLRAAMRVAESRALTRLPAFSIILAQLGFVLLAADELEEALALFERAHALAAGGEMADGQANALAGMVRVHTARGDFDAASACLLELESLARTRNVGLWEGDLSVPRRRCEIARAAAGLPFTLSPVGATDGTGARWSVADEARDVCTLLEALWQDGAEATARATTAAARIRLHAEPRGRNIASCVALLVQALLEDGPDRWRRVDRALSRAASAHYIQPLLEIGPRLGPLLEAASGQPVSRAARVHAHRLLARLRREENGRECGAVTAVTLPDADPAPAAALTDREREVLAHLCRGLSNKAIARQMYVSPETVKTHLSHIFDKLQVSRRTEAIERARALSLTSASPA